MGSQTLEILRQGVWASITGGWFYDPHQNVFCNATHLYIWLFLLCSPFLSYLYFPATIGTWAAYCATVALLFGLLKVANLLLHRMYDTAQGSADPNQRRSAENDATHEEEGIELQELGRRGVAGATPPVGCSSRNSFIEPRSDNSNADSQGSLENNPTSTIDLKVDVHRKNSSESSEGCVTVEEPASRPPEISSIPLQQRGPPKPPRVPRNQIGLNSTQPSEHNNSEFNINLALMQARLQSLASDPFLENCSKSAIQLTPNARRDSSGSTFQLGARRHSNFSSRPPPRPVYSVRRIKSTALETCCPPPSVSNLSPHPNSAEALGNAHALLPPPSSSLVRNPHLNLLPNSEQNFPESSYIAESVYPIAELADERPTDEGSHCVSDTDSDMSRVGSDTETDNSLKGVQSDSDTENNGSRSPLLDRAKNDVIVQNNQKTSENKRWKEQSNSAGELDIDCSQYFVKYNSVTKKTDSEEQEQASASSKDMLLEPSQEPVGLEWLFKTDGASDGDAAACAAVPTTSKVEEAPRSLGAIPKTSGIVSVIPRRRESNTAPLLTAFLSTRSDFPMLPICLPGAPDTFRPRLNQLDRNHRNRHRKLKRSTRTPRQTSTEVHTPELNKKIELCLTNTLDQTENVHFATSFNDTSEGAIHCFLDEHGNWMSYTFDKKGPPAIAEPAIANVPMSTDFSISCPVSSSAGDTSADIATSTAPMATRFRFPDEIETIAERRQKRYYRLTLWKRVCSFKISMDRLQLLALLDRDMSTIQAILAIILAFLVAFLGAAMLHLGFYTDIFAFVFCLVIAGSQYSLLKSVQPDAASPVHGFNKTVAYSRPIYFCICASLAVAFHYNLQNVSKEQNDFTIYGLPISTANFLQTSRDLLASFILFFPVLFSLGLFPQISTFMMYALEQIDMHVFGGNATCGLLAAVLGVLRSVVVTLLLIGPAYGGLVESNGRPHILYSVFCAFLVSLSYHLSRSASDFSCLWNLIKTHLLPSDLFAPFNQEKNDAKADHTINIPPVEQIDSAKNSEKELNNLPETIGNLTAGNKELADPLPAKLQTTVNTRFKNDLLVCPVIALCVLALHGSTVFSALQPDLNPVLRITTAVVGFLLHYVVPQLRKQLPWLCVSHPVLRPHEHGQFEVRTNARVMWFERLYVIFGFVERNILYPLLFLSALTADGSKVVEKFGPITGTFIVVICGMKCLRSSYSDTASQYLILIFCELFFSLDYKSASETFLIDYAVVAIVYRKISEFLLKMHFVVTYIAPWQITWGSAFHAFAQPFSVPHSAMLFLQAAISAILSTPLNPFLGSAIFLTSYVRPVKFWERDYNTRRMDHSNTRLASQLDRNLGNDDNNLNSIFYEHLTRSLQHSLCGDLILGRWGPVVQGDCFVLASDYLNCLVHVIELGNGLCTFQVRGLEFRGTYCQQREVEAISEGVEENDGCCCFSPGHLPRLLSLNAMFSVRWLAWQVAASQYVLEGYSISDNSAVTTLQVFEFRKLLITYYVKSIVYYTIMSNKLQSWITSRPILDALQPTLDRGFVDLDPIFNQNLDEDFDCRSSGITRSSFCTIYSDWIQFCANKRSPTLNTSRDSPLVSLCMGLALLARRTLGAAAHHSVSSVEFFLHGLHALFKGDFRITSARDEWVFADMDLLHGVVAPAVRMSLKLHQDHFMSPEEYEDPVALFEAISGNCSNHLNNTNTTELRNNYNQSENNSNHNPSGAGGDLLSEQTPGNTLRSNLSQSGNIGTQSMNNSGILNQSQSTGTGSNQSGTTGTVNNSSNTVNKCDGTCSAQCGGLVISHEADPLWRRAVLSGTPNLLALRHVMDDGTDEYRVVRLSKRYLTFRVIRLNRECVRGLWAGQQQELVYLRNRNPERGSIQNAKQALRNIINSSCDQPIGYPIYVSPLTTSYAETNEQLTAITGGAFTLQRLKQTALNLWTKVRRRCREGCSSGSAVELGEGVYMSPPVSAAVVPGGTLTYGSQNIPGPRGGTGLATCTKPSSSTLLAGLLNRSDRESLNRSEREGSRSERDSSSLNRNESQGVESSKEKESTERDRIGGLLRFERERENNDPVEPIGRITALLNRFDRAERERESRENSASRDLEPVIRITALLNRIERDRESLALNKLERERDLNGCAVNTKSDREKEREKLVELLNRAEKAESLNVTDREMTIDYWEKLSGLLNRAESGGDTVRKRCSRTSESVTDNKDNDKEVGTIGDNYLDDCDKYIRRAKIIDPTQVYDCLDRGRRIDVVWPSETMRSRGGRSSWVHWVPQAGMIGVIVHSWRPNHIDPQQRSNNDKIIVLLHIADYFVPIAESGIKIVDVQCT